MEYFTLRKDTTETCYLKINEKKKIALNRTLLKKYSCNFEYEVVAYEVSKDLAGDPFCIWIARDEYSDTKLELVESSLYIYLKQPEIYTDSYGYKRWTNREVIKTNSISIINTNFFPLPEDLFPEVKFEDGPRLYKLYIKSKNDYKDDLRKT